MNATPRPTTEDVMSTRAFVRDMSDTTTSKEAFCEKYTVELQDDALRSVLCRIADVEICPEHRWTAKDLAELFANAVNSYDAMKEALDTLLQYAIYGLDGLPGPDHSLTRAVEKAQAALALAKGEVRS